MIFESATTEGFSRPYKYAEYIQNWPLHLLFSFHVMITKVSIDWVYYLMLRNRFLGHRLTLQATFYFLSFPKNDEFWARTRVFDLHYKVS